MIAASFSSILNTPIGSGSQFYARATENQEPGKGRKAMSWYGIRALKLPFESKELGKDLGVLERCKPTSIAALSID